MIETLEPIHVRQNNRFLTIVTKQFYPPPESMIKRCRLLNTYQSEMYTKDPNQNTKSAVTVWVFEKGKPVPDKRILLDRINKRIAHREKFEKELNELCQEFETEVIKALNNGF